MVRAQIVARRMPFPREPERTRTNLRFNTLHADSASGVSILPPRLQQRSRRLQALGGAARSGCFPPAVQPVLAGLQDIEPERASLNGCGAAKHKFVVPGFGQGLVFSSGCPAHFHHICGDGLAVAVIGLGQTDADGGGTLPTVDHPASGKVAGAGGQAAAPQAGSPGLGTTSPRARFARCGTWEPWS